MTTERTRHACSGQDKCICNSYSLSRRQFLAYMGAVALPIVLSACTVPSSSVYQNAASSSSRQQYVLTLDRLECSETEDYLGSDECRLEVYVDGVLKPALKKDLNDGEQWLIDTSYIFEQSATIKLWDEDSEGDDLLGTTAINAEPQDPTAIEFNLDDASYWLYYHVVATSQPYIDPVDQALMAFNDSPESGVWPNLSKDDLLANIRDIVKDPLNVAQGSTPFCGPAAVVYELVSRFPLRYVEICRSLFETGQFYGRTKLIAPSADLLASNAPTDKDISSANWMLLATLRDVENMIFDVEEDSGELAAGISTPWEMKTWTNELLGFDTIEFESNFVYGEFDAMRQAQEVRDRGGVAFLLINQSLLKNEDPTIGYPDHWVSLVDNLSIDEGTWYIWDSGHISFDCFSWGGKQPIKAGEGRFEDCFWGVVTGEA
jgi:hypothetical protein